SDNHLVIKSRISEKTQFWNFDETLVSSIDKKVSGFSPDFNIFTTIEANNKVNLWKRDGKLISSIKVKNEKANLQNNFYEYIGGLTIHRNEERILFSSNNNILAIRTDENTVELWKSDGNFLGTIQGNMNKNIDRFNYGDYGYEHNSFSLPMSFSSDSKSFAIRTGKNEVKIWKIENNKLSLLETVKGKGDLINDIKFIPNSNKLAITGVDDTVKLWQLPNKQKEKPQLLKTFRGHSNLIKSISFSPNSNLIASASYDNTVKLWQPNGSLYKNFTAHKNKVNSVSFSPDGKLIASASNDKTVKVWQPDGKVIKNFEEHGNAVTQVSFSPDDKLIASASKDNTVKIWSLQSEEVKTLPSDEPVTSISFSPDGKMIATASTKNIKLWSVDGTPLTTYERLGNGSVSFSPDGKSIAAAGYQGIKVWDFDLDKLIKRGCNWGRDYLKNNPNVEDGDRTLCDDVK
ncbi:MAG: WD40 repeat domain-containing protein, partial [Cyanobacteria bacterium J06629_18]